MVKKSLEVNSPADLVDFIVELIQEKKGEKITIVDLKGIPSAVTDFFVICHGNSNTQVEAIANHIERETRTQLKEKPMSVEGRSNSLWVLLDYFSIVVHVFYKEARAFYDIESLWADAEIKELEEQN